MDIKTSEAAPVIADAKDFDRSSGNVLERLVFNHRVIFGLLCLLATIFLALQSLKLGVNADFDKVVPQNHPYIKNYFENRGKIGGVGNVVRVVVENNEGGDIFDPKFLQITREINDSLYLTPGVDRAWMRSIWTSSVRWTEVTEEGFRGGTVMPDNYDGSPETMEALKRNIQVAGITGTLIGSDNKSVMYVVPLLEKYSDTGKRIDYGDFSKRIEEIRSKYDSSVNAKKSNQSGQVQGIKIYVVGFAKLVGDLLDGLSQVILFFAMATVVAVAIIYIYTRCIRSTFLVVACSIVAVIWQLGLISTMGFVLDPYSILVPFLIFAIGVSHGAQKMNGIMQDVGRGTDKYVAARYTFRRLFLAGITALLADAVGFAVLVIIDIPVIKDLAITASTGVAVLIVTNLLLLPVALSYVGVSAGAAQRSLVDANAPGQASALDKLWRQLEKFTQRRYAVGAIVVAFVLTLLGIMVSFNLKIGDLDPGAPELRHDSRYNQDVQYINGHFRLSGDQLVVMVKTSNGGCEKYQTLLEIDRLAWLLKQVPGVQNATSLADNVIATTSGLNEGNPKWLTLSRNALLLGGAVNWTSNDNPGLVDTGCSLVPLVVSLTDHKADTLDRVVAAVEKFASDHNQEDVHFLLAAGSAGVEAATNSVVRSSIIKMYLAVYGAVGLLCFITFRSWRAVVVALVPLIITSILCKALMVFLGIGLKVATLPVIALGVGIGVDYALYLLSVQLTGQRAGMTLTQAYSQALAFTGKVVALVGVTLAAGVITWAWSPIKFQADMGILLTFMFLWNMIGALVLIPALSYFLINKNVKADA